MESIRRTSISPCDVLNETLAPHFFPPTEDGRDTRICPACKNGQLGIKLGKTGAYVAGDYSIADIACFPWTMTHKAQGFTLDDYPNVKRWYAEVRTRPQVQAGLAIGKFVKEPFDEEARRWRADHRG